MPASVPAMTPRATSVPVRLARILRLVARGLWMVHTRYASLPPGRQDEELRCWARKLLAILRVEVRSHNARETLPERCLLASNHVSWLDIFAVYAVTPGLFVAKSARKVRVAEGLRCMNPLGCVLEQNISPKKEARSR